MRQIIFATRPSALARWQTRWVIAALEKNHSGVEFIENVITTKGDRILDRPLPEIGGKGLFTQELESELLGGNVHAAVHSLKDLPVENSPGLTVGAVPRRADVCDTLVSAKGYTLKTLPEGALVGTSSLRRTAQLLAVRPDLRTASLRGNVDTRIRKALEDQYDAIILAGAGLTRLGLEEHVSEWLPMDVMLPAPGQGALGVQCRSKDAQTLELLTAIEDPAARLAVTAERVFLLALGGGCAVPVAAYAEVDSDPAQSKTINLTGVVASTDGRQVVKVTGSGSDPEELGRRLAAEAIELGADKILEQLPLTKE